jgi:general L-amino acid transport system substrate-binding protein
MIFMGKVLVSLAWLFWLLIVDNSAIGQDNNSINLEYNPTYGTTYDRVMERGYVICGTNDEFPGFSQEVYDAETGGIAWEGFDVDICRAVAATMFGDANAIEFTIVNGKTRFDFLIDGTIDILSAATTYTFTRNVLKRLEFGPTTYYDGQGFIVRKTLGVSSAKQLEGARICFSSTGTGAKNIADFFATHEINYIPVSVPPDQKTKQIYIDGECDMYGTDRSGLASNRLGFKDPDRHMILPEIISKEPLGPVVRYGDQQWSDIVRWSIYVLFIAEEMGIDSINIDTFKNNIDPNIQRFMGEKNGLDHPNLGAKLKLPATWSYDIIKQVGNYKEIYERNIKKKLGLSRGLNKLYNHGGLLYAPPLK